MAATDTSPWEEPPRRSGGPPTIKAVLFDFGQTLVDSADGFRRAEKDAQAAIFRDLAITDHDEFKKHYRRIRKEFHENSDLSRFNIWKAVYWYYCREAPAEKLTPWEQAYWATVERFTRVFPEVPEVLELLSARYDHLALITNTQGQTDEGAHRFTGYPCLVSRFSAVVVAGDSGIPPKPDPRPFAACLEQLAVAAEEAVYVGDDWRNDICGAREAGLHPIWLKHHMVKRNYPEVDDTDIPVITSLADLPRLLETL